MSHPIGDEEDTVLNRRTIDQLSLEDLDRLLARKRERRLLAYHIYKENLEKALASQEDRINTKLRKECSMFEKELERLDKLLAKLDVRVNNIMANRLQLDPTYHPGKAWDAARRQAKADVEATRSPREDEASGS